MSGRSEGRRHTSRVRPPRARRIRHERKRLRSASSSGSPRAETTRGRRTRNSSSVRPSRHRSTTAGFQPSDIRVEHYRRNPAFCRVVRPTMSYPSEREIVGIIAFIILGLCAGFIAKALLPGDDPGGFIVTAIIGVAGCAAGRLHRCGAVRRPSPGRVLRHLHVADSDRGLGPAPHRVPAGHGQEYPRPAQSQYLAPLRRRTPYERRRANRPSSFTEDLARVVGWLRAASSLMFAPGVMGENEVRTVGGPPRLSSTQPMRRSRNRPRAGHSQQRERGR